MNKGYFLKILEKKKQRRFLDVCVNEIRRGMMFKTINLILMKRLIEVVSAVKFRAKFRIHAVRDVI